MKRRGGLHVYLWYYWGDTVGAGPLETHQTPACRRILTQSHHRRPRRQLPDTDVASESMSEAAGLSATVDRGRFGRCSSGGTTSWALDGAGGWSLARRERSSRWFSSAPGEGTPGEDPRRAPPKGISALWDEVPLAALISVGFSVPGEDIPADTYCHVLVSRGMCDIPTKTYLLERISGASGGMVAPAASLFFSWTLGAPGTKIPGTPVAMSGP